MFPSHGNELIHVHANTCSLQVMYYCSWKTLVTECLLVRSVFITIIIKTSISCVVLWSTLIRHNKHAHTEIYNYLICRLLVVYSTCSMVGHHCTWVQTMDTRTYATCCWIQNQLMWMLLIRWCILYMCMCVVIVCYFVSFNKLKLPSCVYLHHLFI